jgi:thiamine-monophosphate kinase
MRSYSSEGRVGMSKAIATEEDLVQNYLAPLAAGFSGAFGLKDDCAAIKLPPGNDLVVTTDALVSGIHFLPDETPENIAWRALAVNVSDLAAKGASPLCYLMALSLPEAPGSEWMMRFAGALKEAQDHFSMHLIGGDTDRRAGVPLSVTITAMGTVPEGEMVRRAKARPGDRIFVSGTLGDAGLGLALRRNPDARRSWPIDKTDRQFLIDRFLRPTPRLELSPMLLEHATAAMDLSDGLAKDLDRLVRTSGVGARIAFDLLPRSPAAARVFADTPDLAHLPLNAGDDYEILATVPAANAQAFEDAALEAGIAVTDIGQITKAPGLVIHDEDGAPMTLDKAGHDHF